MFTFYLEAELETSATLELIDIKGQTLDIRNVQGEVIEDTYDVNSLPNALYVLKVTTPTEDFVIKVVKQ